MRTTLRLAVICSVFFACVRALGTVQAAETVVTVPRADTPVQVAIDLPKETPTYEGKIPVLVSVVNPEYVIPAQVIPARDETGLPDPAKKVLLAVIPPGHEIPPGKEAAYHLRWIPATKDTSPFSFEEANDKTLRLLEDGKPVYAFNHGVIECDSVPKSDGRRTRACYLHPVWGMEGEILTDDFPKDHYHHHGIFWTWPHVRLGDKEYSLWEGVNMRHHFRKWLLRETGPVAAVLAFEDGWFVGDEQVVTERIWIRTFKSAPENRSFDIAITCIPDGEPVTLWGAEGKSYGGMTMRFAKRKNTVITVPSGRTKEDLKETKLPWADFTAEFADASGPSGAAIMVPKEHPAYPPTWLTRHYGVLCVGYPGPEPATFTKEKPLNLDYRVWIHKGAASLDQLKGAYEGYLQSRDCKFETKAD